jgi:hypothetical protein
LRRFGLGDNVAGMAGLRALFLMAGWLTACSPDSGPRHWAVGRWAVDDQPCDEAWLTYAGDGSWSDRFTTGRWTSQGSRLTLRLTHTRRQPFSASWSPLETPICHTEIVQRRSDSELVTLWEDGTRHRLTRCAASVLPTVACVGDCARVTPFDPRGWASSEPAAKRSCP